MSPGHCPTPGRPPRPQCAADRQPRARAAHTCGAQPTPPHPCASLQRRSETGWSLHSVVMMRTALALSQSFMGNKVLRRSARQDASPHAADECGPLRRLHAALCGSALLRGALLRGRRDQHVAMRREVRGERGSLLIVSPPTTCHPASFPRRLSFPARHQSPALCARSVPAACAVGL